MKIFKHLFVLPDGRQLTECFGCGRKPEECYGENENCDRKELLKIEAELKAGKIK